MKRWNYGSKYGLPCLVENEAIDKFLGEIVEVCKKHGLSLSHEDTGGAFKVEEFSESNIKWLLEAADATKSAHLKKLD